MTRRLFDEDAYTKEFEAEVTACEPAEHGFWVTLDQTAFYPEGGGQPADFGTLSTADGRTAAVTDTQEKAGVIRHRTDLEITSGTRVTGRIDWERRFDHMQNHSGEHIISGLVHARYGYDNVGFHMSETAVDGVKEITVDWNGALDWPQLKEIERQANEAVWKNFPIEITYPTPEELAVLPYRSKKELTGRIRIVTFPGYDICACCGTHVRRTGEIGCIKITSLANYKSGVRISMLCGSRALLDYEQKQEALDQTARALSVRQADTPAAVDRLRDELAALRFAAAGMRKKLNHQAADAIPAGTDRYLAEDPDAGIEEVREMVNYCMEKVPLVLGICRAGEGKYNYILGSTEDLAQQYGKCLNAALAGRGGGKPRMVQGSFAASLPEIREAFGRLGAK